MHPPTCDGHVKRSEDSISARAISLPGQHLYYIGQHIYSKDSTSARVVLMIRQHLWYRAVAMI